MKRLLIILLLLIIIALSGCAGSEEPLTVENGDTVHVNYIGSQDDGTIFDTSLEDVAVQNNVHNPNRNYSPLSFVVGSGQMIKGFDDAVVGMTVGENKTVTIPHMDAYGDVRQEYIVTYTMEDFHSANITPVLGEKIFSQGQEGTIVDVSQDEIVVDFNHHLAGEDLTFFIEIVSVEKA